MSVKSEDPVFYHARKPPTVLFAHGKESGPWGEKIVALAEVARKHGYESESPDFMGIDDPEARVKLLLKAAFAKQSPFILVGSSMGGYVALRASAMLQTVGLFLMAPAIGIPGYQEPHPVPACNKMTIIHAWKDELIPAKNVIEYAENYQAELHLLNSDHRLSGQIPLLVKLFDSFIGR